MLIFVKKFKFFLNILGIFQFYLFPIYLIIVLFIGGLFGLWSFSFQNALDLLLAYTIFLFIFVVLSIDFEENPEKHEPVDAKKG